MAGRCSGRQLGTLITVATFAEPCHMDYQPSVKQLSQLNLAVIVATELCDRHASSGRVGISLSALHSDTCELRSLLQRPATAGAKRAVSACLVRLAEQSRQLQQSSRGIIHRDTRAAVADLVERLDWITRRADHAETSCV